MCVESEMDIFEVTFVDLMMKPATRFNRREVDDLDSWASLYLLLPLLSSDLLLEVASRGREP